MPHDVPSVCHFSPQLAETGACTLGRHEHEGALMKIVVFALMLICAGCASYVTPGAAVRLQDIDRPDIAAAAARKASPNFPARLAVVRVQAPQYRSYSSESYGNGRFSVLTTQELLTDSQMNSIQGWPALAGAVPINRLLLPPKFESFDDLRLSAAQIQADVLLVYTLDTSFRVQGRGYGPLAAISLGVLPDRDAYITSTASALFIDVRTGFIYGVAEATAKASGLTNVWSSRSTIDKKRVEAEQQAFDGLMTQAAATWKGIATQYQSMAGPVGR
jgi:hypothetical protein